MDPAAGHTSARQVGTLAALNVPSSSANCSTERMLSVFGEYIDKVDIKRRANVSSLAASFKRLPYRGFLSAHNWTEARKMVSSRPVPLQS